MTTADENAKIVTQYLVREAQRMGGSTLRPWQAFALENDTCAARGDMPGCNDLAKGGDHSDRLSLAVPDTSGPSLCTINKVTGSFTSGTIFADMTNVEDPATHAVTSVCCLYHYVASTDPVTGDPLTFVDTVSAVANKRAILVRGGFHMAVTFAATQPAVAAGACTANFIMSATNQGAPLKSVAQPTSIAGYGGGNLIPVLVSTLYMGCNRTDADCTDHSVDRALFLFTDHNGGSGTVTVDPGELFLVSPNIYDFQVGIGYDFDPRDGFASDTPGGCNDEWSFNADPSVGCGTGTEDVAAAQETDMRMISLGVVTGVEVHDPTYTSTAQLTGGLAKSGTGIHLRASESRAGLRGLSIFR
jgi:hypothetical protein